MSFLTLLSAASSLVGASHSTDTFAILNCTDRAITNVNITYTPLVGSRVLETHSLMVPPQSVVLETSSAQRDAEELLMNFVPASDSLIPAVSKIPLRPLSGSGVDVRLVYVGLLINENGNLTWKRLRQHELAEIDADTGSTAAICSTLFYYGFGM